MRRSRWPETPGGVRSSAGRGAGRGAGRTVLLAVLAILAFSTALTTLVVPTALAVPATASAPVSQSGPDQSGPVVAQEAQDADPAGGFGEEGQIGDGHGNTIWDYEVLGKQPRGVADVGQVFRGVPLVVAGLLFALIQFLVAAMVWMLGFALELGLADLLLIPVTEIVDVYQAFVDELGLVPLALMLCVFWFGLAALRGRVGRGVGEIAVSFVLAVTLGAVLAAPGHTLLGEAGLLGRAKDLGSTVAMLAVQEPTAAWRTAECGRASTAGQPLPDGCYVDEFGDRVANVDDPGTLAVVMEVWLVDMFVRQPHQHIMYGQRIDCPVAVNVRRWARDGDGGAEDEQVGCQPLTCVERYDTIVAASVSEARAIIDEGDADGSADPHSYMYDMMHPQDGGYAFDDGCRDAEAVALAEHSDGGDWRSVAIAVFTLVALCLLFLFVAVGVVFPLAIGQVMIAVLVVALVFVLPVALLGGTSRQVLWKWAGLLLGALFMIIVALFGLSLMLITTDLLLQSTWHLSISMLLACFSSVVFLVLQRRLLRGGIAGGRSAADALGRVGSGGQAAASVADRGQAGGGWARPGDSAMHWAVRRVTFAGARENRQRRHALTREMRAYDRVRERHPEFARREMYRQLSAQDSYRAGDSHLRQWRRRQRLRQATRIRNG